MVSNIAAQVAEKEARDMSERTQALLKLLFDVQTYRSAMLELDIDTGLMPLGKLSKRHVDEGFKILMEVSRHCFRQFRA